MNQYHSQKGHIILFRPIHLQPSTTIHPIILPFSQFFKPSMLPTIPLRLKRNTELLSIDHTPPLYSSPSPNSRRPALEFRYSFLHHISPEIQGSKLWDEPLDSPVHGNVGDDERRSDVENLASEPSPGIEDGCVQGAGEWALSVGAERV